MLWHARRQWLRTQAFYAFADAGFGSLPTSNSFVARTSLLLENQAVLRALGIRRQRLFGQLAHDDVLCETASRFCGQG